jgi:sec-independent protein translocase protein TatB
MRCYAGRVFGIGGSEILVILVIALLFLGPDKLPDAAKQISKGIRDLKRQSRILQETIENDEHIGGAIRDLKSALRGDEIVARPQAKKPRPKPAEIEPGDEVVKVVAPPEADQPALAPVPADTTAAVTDEASAEAAEKPAITLPPSVGESDVAHGDGADDDLASLVRPAAGTVAKGSEPTDDAAPAPAKHHG